MTDPQKVFSEIADQLDPGARRLLSMPDYAQVDENLVNMGNYFPLIQGLMDAVKPKSICEIGSDQGTTTRLLRAYCKNKGCTLDSVDPSFEMTGQLDELTRVHSSRSIDYLKESAVADIYFVDGDHNYYTVMNELTLIASRCDTGRSHVMFVHDVGWPCGYIDAFYDESGIPKPERKTTKKISHLSLFQPIEADDGCGLPMSAFSMEIPPGKRSGVRRALEDFVAGNDDWRFASIPSIYGLAVLIGPGEGTGSVESEFKNLQSLFEMIEPFLAILEFNRIQLLETIHRAGSIWHKQRDAIERYCKQITSQQEEITRLKSRLQDDD